MREFKQIVAAREEFFKKDLPTSTMVEVSHLSEPGLLVEIRAIAAIWAGSWKSGAGLKQEGRPRRLCKNSGCLSD